MPLPSEGSNRESEATAGGPRNSPSTVLDDALARVKALDPELAQTLSREVDALRDSRQFGLVFEKHLPETARLSEHPIKRGARVALRRPGKGEEGDTWLVGRVVGAGENRVAHLTEVEDPVPVTELVMVRDFGEPVFPGLRQSRDPLMRGEPGDPIHVVINGENHHALQALRYTHRKAVDLIYINPPYNTGNKGWRAIAKTCGSACHATY